MRARHLPLTVLLAVGLLLAACGGDSGPLSNREACTQVEAATKQAGKKGATPASVNEQLAEAAAAAADVQDPQVRKAARAVQAASKQPTTTAATGTFDFSRVGAIATLLDRCEQYLR